MNWQNLLDLADGQVEIIIAVSSALVAVMSALVARGETRKQRRLQTVELRRRIDHDSLEWGNEAVDAMGEAAELALSPYLTVQERRARRLNIARRLSVLVDRGRFFFPNIDPDDHGADKEDAYKGYRPPILDALIYAYHETRLIDEDGVRGEDSAAFITECRRLLVSELQAHLDPRCMDEIVERYNSQRLDARHKALDRVGRLGVILDVRRPGILTHAGDTNWTDRIGADERKAILRAYNPNGEHG